MIRFKQYLMEMPQIMNFKSSLDTKLQFEKQVPKLEKELLSVFKFKNIIYSENGYNFYKYDNYFFAIKDDKLVFYNFHSVENVMNIKCIIQYQLHKLDKSLSNTVIFNALLTYMKENKYSILSDSEQTSSGVKFWLELLSFSIKKNLSIFYIDRNSMEYKIQWKGSESIENFIKKYDIWGHPEKHRNQYIGIKYE